jgi:hypothetical protein
MYARAVFHFASLNTPSDPRPHDDDFLFLVPAQWNWRRVGKTLPVFVDDLSVDHLIATPPGGQFVFGMNNSGIREKKPPIADTGFRTNAKRLVQVFQKVCPACLAFKQNGFPRPPAYRVRDFACCGQCHQFCANRQTPPFFEPFRRLIDKFFVRHFPTS